MNLSTKTTTDTTTITTTIRTVTAKTKTVTGGFHIQADN